MSEFFIKHPQRRLFAVFFAYAFALGGIYPRLGDIQLGLGIREGALGLSIMGLALGTQSALMLAPGLIERIGHRKVLGFGIPTLAAVMALAGLAPTPLILFALLTLAGLCIGAVEIVINVEADRTEAKIGRRLMNRAHAFWSMGFFAAGLSGALARGVQLSPFVHLGLAFILVLGATLVLTQSFDAAPARTETEAPHPKFVRPTLAILALVGLTLSAMLMEGAGADWSVIYMRDVFATAPFLSGLAFVVGAFAQALARYFADPFLTRYGARNVAAALLSALGTGVTLVVVAPNPAIALLGFFVTGIGTSAIFPMAMSAAAQRTDRPAAVNVAALAQLSFLAFLVGPPALGYVAEHFGIRYTFAIGLPFVLLSFLMLSSLRQNPQGRAQQL